MDMAAHERPSTTPDPESASAPTASPAPANSGRPQRHPYAAPAPRLGLLARLSSQFGSRGLTRRGPALDDAARRELLLHGVAGTATILSVRTPAKTQAAPADSISAPPPDNPAGDRRADIRTRAEKRVDARATAERRAKARDADTAEAGWEFWVRVQLEDRHAFETRVRQRVNASDREWMQPGDIVCCRVDPGDNDRVVLYLPAPEETSRTNIAKILADGRRARATVLAAAPVAADYTGRDDPVLRLDLELHAWDEPAPWRVRVVQPVPLSAMELIDLGRHLEVAFFTVDRGESVAVDWAASREV
ncbi:hypothetical protein VMT65_19455 [Nocardia sp. CDC153]|uniref:hypothetical protein n=1 Tax=Nocardia sp. CDC153 TaxID=3112167 RepID=UPI002DBF04CF|nr:hypothetical protein [Nocardia sp. CDC153]MEC3955227.1 hypothetical protein [Nocardia sp. CDC153]